MKFAKYAFLAVLAIALILGTAGCSYQSSATYFGGGVLVQYYQTKVRGENDNLTITFYDPGTYHLAFSTTPGESKRGNQYMPDDRDVTITTAPRPYVISQYVLPDYLRITITKDGVSETHDFQ